MKLDVNQRRVMISIPGIDLNLFEAPVKAEVVIRDPDDALRAIMEAGVDFGVGQEPIVIHAILWCLAAVTDQALVQEFLDYSGWEVEPGEEIPYWETRWTVLSHLNELVTPVLAQEGAS